MDASTRGAGVTWPPRGYGITVMSAWPRAMLNKLAVAPQHRPRPAGSSDRAQRGYTATAVGSL